MPMMSEEEFRKRLLKPLDNIRNNNLNYLDKFSMSDKKERVHVSLRGYVDNPSGSGTAYLASRKLIKQSLNSEFIKLLREYRREFYAVPYIYPNGDILFHVRVPSEFHRTNKLSYDVLFRLFHDEKKRRANRDIQVFSNCPSFVYTYAYVYNTKGLLIEKFKSILPNQCLSSAPKVRNPIGSMGYEKSTYIAARYLLEGFCLNDSYINMYGVMMTPEKEKELERKITDPEAIVVVYQHAKYNQSKTHRKPLDANVKRDRDQYSKEVAKGIKAARPVKSMISFKTPRSKITAKKAIKNIQNRKNIKH